MHPAQIAVDKGLYTDTQSVDSCGAEIPQVVEGEIVWIGLDRDLF